MARLAAQLGRAGRHANRLKVRLNATSDAMHLDTLPPKFKSAPH
jgi:hypothetical protein